MKHRVWHLRGGIHPPENKLQSLGQALRKVALPDYLRVPLQQHIGSPVTPCVKVGDRALKGQIIADSEKPSAVPVHAPTSGTISAIEKFPVIHPSGLNQLCIQIDSDGEDQWIDFEGVDDFYSLSKSELLSRIHTAGVIGMGGAGFPSSVKLNTGDQQIDSLIINGAECEPYITADDILMQERAVEVVKGIKIVSHILQPKEILIGIEDNKPLAIAALERACADTPIDIVKIPTQYPSGGEKQLIKILTGKEVPTGGLPVHVGVVMHNIGTVYSIYKAIVQGKPSISRIVTLTGQALQNRGNVKALIGTPVKHLLREGGLEKEQLFRIVAGGPMMGFTLPSDELPISKTTNCLIAATYSEMPPAPPEQNCIRCGQCADVCPVTLLPQQLYFFSKSQEFDKAEQHNIFDCIECGACSFVCPSHIPLVQYYRYSKGTIKQLRTKEEKSLHAKERFESRLARLEAEAAEKEAKRKARTAAASQRKVSTAKDSAATDNDKEQELTRLKTAAATAAKLAVDSKKALSKAENNNQNPEELIQLRERVQQLQADAEKAKEALKTGRQKLSKNSAVEISAPEESDLVVQLRGQAATAQDHLKQMKKALLASKTDHSSDLEKLEEQVKSAKEEVNNIKARLREALAAQTEETSTTNTSITKTKASDLNASEKVAAALARNEYRKAEKALESALAENKPEPEINQFRTQLQEAEIRLKSFNENTNTTPAVKES